MFFLQIGMALVPCGLIMFAWTAQTHQHWVLPLLGGATCAVGVLMAFVCIQTYLVMCMGNTPPVHRPPWWHHGVSEVAFYPL